MRVWCYTCEDVRHITDGHPVVCPSCHNSFVEEMVSEQSAPDPYQRHVGADHNGAMAADGNDESGDDSASTMSSLALFAAILQARSGLSESGPVSILLDALLRQRLASMVNGSSDDGSQLLEVIRTLVENSEEEGVAPASNVALEALVPAELDEASAGEPCPVCQEPIPARQSVQRLGCQHFFHPDCIVPWLKIHATCPVCRYDVNEHVGEVGAAAAAPHGDVHAHS